MYIRTWWPREKGVKCASGLTTSRSPKVRGAQNVLGTRPRYAVHPHRRRRTRTRCARARRGQFRAGKRQTRLGANRLLVVAWGSAGRSLAQVSASFAVFGDGRRTPRLRFLSLLCLCSDMLERARGSGRRGVVICRCVECREREMCCKCSKYVNESEREREKECGHL